MNNKIKVILGLFLIVLAFACTVGILYFVLQQDQTSDQEITALQVQLANLIADRSAQVLSEADQEKVQRPPIRLEDVLARAEMIYGPKELERKEGVLWIDRKTSQLMVTLGAVNGIVSGTYLGVYEERRQSSGLVINEKIDDMVVEQAYDIISYVRPVKKSIEEFSRDYYRVRAQGSF